jgi:hypothetical protein
MALTNAEKAAAWRRRHPDRVKAYKTSPRGMELRLASDARRREKYRDRFRLEQAARREADPERIREINRRAYRKNPLATRDRHLQYSYGITYSQYVVLRQEQDDCCAICGRPETARVRGGGERQLAVDHDHESGAIRGLLCHSCNIGLGYFGESAERLDFAASYLRAARKRRLRIVEVS